MPNAPVTAAATAASRSASSATTSAPTSPSSNALWVRPMRRARCLPTATLPVNVTMSTCSQLTSASPTSWASPVTSAIISAGRPAASRVRTNRTAVSGAFSEGLTITLLPVATAGTTLVTTWLSGRLNGVMAQTRPSGSGRVRASLAGPFGVTSVVMVSPPSRVASAAPNRSWATARRTSLAASLRAVPVSVTMEYTKSSAASATRSAVSRRISPRSKAESAQRNALAARAASTAWSALARPACPTTSPV